MLSLIFGKKKKELPVNKEPELIKIPVVSAFVDVKAWAYFPKPSPYKKLVDYEMLASERRSNSDVWREKIELGSEVKELRNSIEVEKEKQQILYRQLAEKEVEIELLKQKLDYE